MSKICLLLQVYYFRKIELRNKIESQSFLMLLQMRRGTPRSLLVLCEVACADLQVPKGVLPIELVEKLEIIRTSKVFLNFRYTVSHVRNEINCEIEAYDINNNLTAPDVSLNNLRDVLEKGIQPQFIPSEYSRLSKKIKRSKKIVFQINALFDANVELINPAKSAIEKRKIMNDIARKYFADANQSFTHN